MATERTSVSKISIFLAINSAHFITVNSLKEKKLVFRIKVPKRKDAHRRHIRKISKSQTNEERRLLSGLIEISLTHSLLSFRTV